MGSNYRVRDDDYFQILCTFFVIRYLLSAISPAVVVPTILTLKESVKGINEGIYIMFRYVLLLCTICLYRNNQLNCCSC